MWPALGFECHEHKNHEYFIRGVVKRDSASKCRRAKTPGQHARAAEGMKNIEIAFPRKAGTRKDMRGAEGGNANIDFLNTSNEITPRSKSIHIHNEFRWFSDIMESVFIFCTPLMKYERRFSRLHKSTPPAVTHSVTSNKTANIPLEGLRKPFLALWPRARAIKKCERQRGRELQN